MNTLIYLFEPLDGWCYGFGPVVSALEKEYASRLQFDVLPAGMITGKQAGALANMAGFIRQVYPMVEQYSGVRFGDRFVNQTLKNGTVTFSSLEPSKVLSIFKHLGRGSTLGFSCEIQQLIFFDGIDPTDIRAYLPLFAKYGIDPKTVLELFASSDIEQQTVREFRQVQQWKIQNLPTLVLQTKEGKATVVASGFTPLGEIKKRLATLLDL